MRISVLKRSKKRFYRSGGIIFTEPATHLRSSPVVSLTSAFSSLFSFFIVSTMKISSHKRQYHPYIPLAFHLRMLPEKVTEQLPRSTRHYWRKKDLQQLTGYELAIEQQDILHTVAVIASNKHLLAVNKALIKIIAISRYISKNVQSIRSGRTSVVNCLIKQINSIVPVMGLRRLVASFYLSTQLFKKRSFGAISDL